MITFPMQLEAHEVIVLIQHYETLVKTLNESAHNFPEEVREEFRQLVDGYMKRAEVLRQQSNGNGQGLEACNHCGHERPSV